MRAPSERAWRFSPVEIAATLVAMALAALFIHQQYTSQLALIGEQHTMALDVAYRATLETYRLEVTTRFKLQVDRPEVLDIMEAALATPERDMPPLRGRLYRQLRPLYEDLRRSGLSHFQFHLADDRTLLRYQLPGLAGDSLFALRPLLRRVNESGQAMSGFEVGRTVPSFRHIFPMGRNGKHLGSVELSLPFDHIQQNLAHLLPNSDFGLLLKRQVIESTVDAGSLEKFEVAGINPDYLIEHPTISRVARNFVQSETVRALEPLLSGDSSVRDRMAAGTAFVVPLRHGGTAYTATFLPIRDILNSDVAYVVRFSPNETLNALTVTLWRQGIFAVLLVLALAIAIHRLRLQRRLLREDIARRELVERNLQLFENIFQHSGEAILVTDRDNNILTANPAFTRLTGYGVEEVRGSNPRLLSSGQTPREVYQTLWQSLRETGHWQGELSDRRKDGAIYPKWASISVICDSRGAITNYMASFTDITERKAAEERIERLAHHDALTGLLNRYSLESRLAQAVVAARREGQRLAVLFIDMDRFKNINDSLGHQIGDLLLKEVAARLQRSVRESDIVARQGGDEFVVALTGIAGLNDVTSVASKLLVSLGETYVLGERALHSTPSIGIAIYPDDGNSVEVLLKNADTAMYHAKESGRNNIQYFTSAMTQAAHERLSIEHDLHQALGEHQLQLYYQPQVRAADQQVVGVEALLRWKHPKRGMVPPDRFIPVAEESGMIEGIGAWVLDEACRQLASWQAAGICLRVAVNLSAHQLRSPHLAAMVYGCLERHRVAADQLELEITESAAMENPEQAIEQLRLLHNLGVHLAIDDFGTGYSSLAYLKHLPIQALKLDRSFVRDIEKDENDATISAATIALAHALGLKVVAEGVESQAQADFLGRQHGCDLLQGYFFGRPEPAETITARLRADLAQADPC